MFEFFLSSNKNLEFINSWLFMSSSISISVIFLSYLAFVLIIGPNYMKNRKPYQIRNIITIYNILQIFFSMYLVYVCGKLHITHGLIPKTCGMETEKSRYDIATGMHYYFLAKVIELLDTVFFVLRKKNTQITYLHIHHHTTMMVFCWATLKYELSIHLMFMAAVNSFIHVIMYTYYGLSSFPQLLKYLWWKKYITTLQLVQFITIITQFVVSVSISECRLTYMLIASFLSNCFMFIYLFGNFYLKNYSNKPMTICK